MTVPFRRCILTGATGYLGARIALHLNQLCPDLKLVLPSRRPEAFGRLSLPYPGSVKFFGINSLTDIVDVIAEGDAVVHLAALNEIDCGCDEVQAFDVNTVQSVRLLLAAKLRKASRFLYFSTAHVYGDPLVGHLHEGLLPRPTHPYALTHRSVEDYVMAAQAKAELDGVVVRLSNAIGAPVNRDVNRWTLLVNDLCKELAQKGRLTLKTPGFQQRDFISLADVERAVDHLLALPRPALGDGLFNLGSGEAHSVRAIALSLAELYAAEKGKPPMLNLPDAEGMPAPEALHFSVEKLKATGFELRHRDLKRTLRETLKFCLDQFAQE